MSLPDAIAALQTVAASLDGIQAAPESPPESVEVFPFSVAFARSGAYEPQSASFADGLHTIFLQIHCDRTVLNYAIERATPYIESFPRAVLADPTLGGAVSEVRAIRYAFGALKYAGTDTIGAQFEIDVKIHLE